MTFWMEQKTESYLIEFAKIAILQEKKSSVNGGRE